jgi:hypothetical protein
MESSPTEADGREEATPRGERLTAAPRECATTFGQARRIGPCETSRRCDLDLARAGAVVLPASARATYHSVKIVEVYTGPGPQYVMLQAYEAGQDQLNFRSLVVYNASGGVVQTNTFGSNDGIPLGALNQAAILIGTSNVAGSFGITWTSTCHRG